MKYETHVTLLGALKWEMGTRFEMTFATGQVLCNVYTWTL